MKIAMLIIGTAALLAGCASASKTHTPDGRVGYTIDCSGSARTWGMCYEKAGKICGSKGYDIISKSGDEGANFAANQAGAYGGTIITRSMVVACKP